MIRVGVGLQGPPGPAMPPARLATTGPLPSFVASPRTLTAAANGALTVNGIAALVGDMVLVLHDDVHNIVYRVADKGSSSSPWRLVQMPGVVYEIGLVVSVGLGSQRGLYRLLTDGEIVVGTTPLTWAQIPEGGGGGGGGSYMAKLVDFDFATTTIQPQSVAAGDVVTGVMVQITTPFDGAPRLRVGTVSSLGAMLDVPDLSLFALGDQIDTDYVYLAPSADTLDITLDANGATTGGGEIYYLYQVNS